jgi:hypothetical protein
VEFYPDYGEEIPKDLPPERGQSVEVSLLSLKILSKIVKKIMILLS